MKTFIFLILLSFPLQAIEWPKEIEGGLLIAKNYCITAKPAEIVVFEYEKDGETEFFPISCKEVLEIAE